MTNADRVLLNARIGELLHEMLLRIRSLTFASQIDDGDPREEINDLADFSHNLPRFIVGHDEFAVRSFDQLRTEVVQHVRRFFPTIDPKQHRYLMLLDMEAESFLDRYRDHNWHKAEPELAGI
jgi:hypothetical protein